MLLLGDCNDHLKDIRDNSIDLLLTDPPYGIEFMGKDWDKALVNAETWKECYRVLKQGKLAFVMCSPRQDVLSRMIVNLQDAGFRTNYTSIYWTFASGFPKAANISKLIDKRGGVQYTEDKRIPFANFLKQKIKESGLSHLEIRERMGLSLKGGGPISQWIGLTENAQPKVPPIEKYLQLKEILNLGDQYDDFIKQEEQREIIGRYVAPDGNMRSGRTWFEGKRREDANITKPATEAAKAMEGAYVGFQPKPAVEVILVVSKGKTLTWLDDCRIPYQSDDKWERSTTSMQDIRGNNYNNPDKKYVYRDPQEANEKGRFPANLLVSDDVLNDGSIHKSGKFADHHVIDSEKTRAIYGKFDHDIPAEFKKSYGDEGSYSRYFSLDAWASCSRFPFLIVPKASKSERNDGLDSIQPIKVNDGRNTPIDNPFQRGETLRTNSHPTVKPLKLMSYLITMGSKEDDLVLDPFCGSGTVCIAAHQLHRKWLGIEMNPEYAEIIKKRLADPLAQLKLTSYLEDKIPQT